MIAVEEFMMNPGWEILLADMGISPARVLKRAGLPENLFTALPVVLAPEEYFRFIEAMDAETGDEVFPIRIIEAMTGEVFSPPLFAAICSPNLMVAASRVSKYKALTGPWKITSMDQGEKFTIKLSWPALLDPPLSLVLAEIMFWLGLMRLACRKSVNAVHLTAPAAPGNPAAYQKFTGVSIDVKPDAPLETSISFSKEDAETPFLTANDAIWQSFEPSLQQRLKSLEASAPLSSQVRALLLEAIPSGNTSAEFISQKLRMGARTLQRRLRIENTSFQEILNETRHTLAVHYLTKTQIAVAEISFLLGYDDPNSFYRAFKGWAAQTPEQVRSAKKAQDHE